MKKIISFVCVCLMALFTSDSGWTYPQLTDGIVDEANILSEMTKQSVLNMFDQEGITNVVVATVSSLDGKNIEQYATDLGNYWGVGSKQYDNGVLLVVAPNEGYVRIATGLGMEKVLTDEKAEMIVQNQMMPYLKKRDFDTAVLMGVQGIIAGIRNTTAFPNKSHTQTGRWIFSIAISILIMLFFYVLSAPEGEKLYRFKKITSIVGIITGVLFFILVTLPKKRRGRSFRFSSGGRFGGGGATGRF